MALAKENFNYSFILRVLKLAWEAVFHSFKTREQISFF